MSQPSSPKRRRVETAHEVVIEAAFFPHIIDLIFAYSDVQALLVLRTTSRDWLERADCRLAYHVSVRGDDRSLELYSEYARGRLKIVTPQSLIGSLFNQPFPWREHVRVCDLTGVTISHALSSLVHMLDLVCIDALRLLDGTPQLPAYIKDLPRAERFVCFPIPLDKSQAYELEDGSIDDCVQERDPVTRVRSLVMHMNRPRQDEGRLLLPSVTWTRFVLVLEPWEAPDIGPNVVQGDVKVAFGDNLTGYMELLVSGVEADTEVTVVGLEGFSPEAFGLTTSDLGDQTLEGALTALMKRYWVAHVDKMREEKDPEEREFMFETRTHAEHCSAMGEADYETETTIALKHAPRHEV